MTPRLRINRLSIALAFLAAAVSACTARPVLLNSERIEQQFGSYGVTILSQDSAVRRTSLYSDDSGHPICRTYAIVQYARSEYPEIHSIHSDVLAGASIGSSFSEKGWSIRKETTHIGSIDLKDPAHPLASMMQLDAPAILATHVYDFHVVNASADIHYATIVETHHPQYLDAAQVIEIYGATDELTAAEKHGIYKLVLLDHWD